MCRHCAVPEKGKQCARQLSGWETLYRRSHFGVTKFSKKFHAFWQTVLIKGEVLGQVSHFYWKKRVPEQRCSTLHALVWISGAPVAGKDKKEVVESFIEKRITCRIPDKDDSPELHRLVTRYQLHKWQILQAKRKCGPNVHHHVQIWISSSRV